MTDDQEAKYIFYTRMAWAIYALVTLALVIVLVLFVAQDSEERFFYALMPAAASYVFRPTDKLIGRLVFRFTGVSRSTGQE